MMAEDEMPPDEFFDGPDDPPSNVVAINNRKPRSKRNAPTEGVIRLGVDVHRVVDECAAALLRCEDLYCRGGELVRVVRDGEPPPNVRRPLGTPTIRTVPPATLLEMLTRVQGFERLDKRTGEWLPTVPSGAVLAALAARGAWTGMRPLVGVLESPALRPDGTVLQRPGYDPATCYLFLPSLPFQRVHERPSRDDAIEARDELLEVVSDFPFADEAHRSAWLAFVLTLFARPAIDGCLPFVAVDATAAGTGKGRLVDATAIIATGREATKTPLPQDDEEMRKRITALLLEGERLAVLDNVADTIDLPAFEAALTATVWRDRLLGRNASVTVPNLMVWAATGNNLEIAGDLARRTLHIRLESRVENPEDRDDFRHPDLLGWVKERRSSLAGAALTILRAHAVAGAPLCGVRPWGSFEAWSRIVAAAVAWVDMPDPQSTRSGLSSSADTMKRAIRTLIDGWARLTANVPEGLTAKAALSILYPPDRLRGQAAPDGFDDLREAIEVLVPTKAGQVPSPAKLAGKLRGVRRRLIGGRMLDGTEDRNGIVRWTIRDAGDAGDAGHVSNPSRGSVSDSLGFVGPSNTRNARNPRREGLE